MEQEMQPCLGSSLAFVCLSDGKTHVKFVGLLLTCARPARVRNGTGLRWMNPATPAPGTPEGFHSPGGEDGQLKTISRYIL